MNSSIPLLIVLITAFGPLFAQPYEGPTHYVWALDSGNQLTPAPSLIRYEPSGLESLVVTNLPGSGQARALSADSQGGLWLCRGNSVHQLDVLGGATGLVLSPPSGSGQAQDVIQLPGSPDTLIAAFGTNAGSSAIGIYDIAGATPGTPVTVVTSSQLDHPRRLAARPDGLRIFVASRGNQMILRFDPTAAMPTVQVLTDLTADNIGPVGLCWDAGNQHLWVTGDYGATQEIGCIDPTAAGAPFAPAILFPPAAAPGLRAPAGLFFDRFRRLYIAGRSQNMGTAGIYTYSADTPAVTPSFVAGYPRTGGGSPPVNCVDVVLQESLQNTCMPVEDGTDNVLILGNVNTVSFHLPEAAGSTSIHQYAAAISYSFPVSCTASFRNGVLESAFLFGGTDPRGIPLVQDELFWGSVAVATPGPPPIPVPGGFVGNLSPVIDITGFSGVLDANGDVQATVDLTGLVDPANALNLDGVELSIAWVTASVVDANQIGYISQPACVILRNPAVSPLGSITTCP